MSKLRVVTFVSLLLVAIAVGCSSSDQGAIDKAVSPTLEADQTATAAPTATSTPTPVPTDTPTLLELFIQTLKVEQSATSHA